MARIPEDEIERLKAEVDLASLVRSSGVALKAHGGGGDLIGLCPFHDDHEPSLVISPKKNLWHCLGACQAGGSVIDWVMRARKVGFRHAVELLREGRGAGDVFGKSGVTTRRILDSPIELDAADGEAMAQVAAYYHQTLKRTPAALEYLQGRGLVHAEMLNAFELGFADRTLGLRLPARQVKAGEELRGRLAKIGLLRQSGHEHFRGCVTFPLRDGDGRIVGMYGRKIGGHLRKGTPLHMYLPGPRKGLFNHAGVAGCGGEIILCESVIDALTFWCAGFRNVTCSYGIEGFTAEHLAALKTHAVQRVLIAYDRDEAGERGAEKLAEKLLAEGLDCYRIQLPRGMDVNEYALKVTPAAQSLGLVIRKAVWLGKGQAPAITTTAAAKEKNLQPPSSPSAAPASKPSLPLPQAPAPSSPSKPSPPVAPAPAPSLPSLAASVQPPPSPPPAPVATVQPPAPVDVEASINDASGEVVIELGDRRYRVRGLAKNLSFEQMKVNVLAARGAAFHVDTFDLYAARARSVFVGAAAGELGVEEAAIKKDLGKVLLKLEELQEAQIAEALKPKEAQPVEVADAAKAEALALLKAPNLLDRILADFEACGVVGERTNKLTGYLAAVSRKLDAPLAVIVQSSSAAGKSSLMEAVLAFVPPEERVKYSAMTGQSLFYMGEMDLKHRILAVAEEQGAERASYALKLLQSEGELTIASTGKDPATGRLETQEYHVEGPVMIFLTTTAAEIDEELLNRCIVLTVDEDRGQTRAIHRLQRRRQTLEGLLAGRERQRVLELHRNAQRLLRPLLVANPFAEKLTFLDDKTRTRRDHVKYLTLIRAIALLHQYQRPVRTVTHRGAAVRYIEVTPRDIEIANALAHEVLGRSLDELPPQTRRLLGMLDAMVTGACGRLKMDRADYRFTRREVREQTGWTDIQVRTHLGRLVELEYVLVHRGGRGQQFVYELLWDGATDGDGKPHLSGLIDAASLRPSDYDEKFEGVNGQFDGAASGHRAAGERGVSAAEDGDNALKNRDLGEKPGEPRQNAHQGGPPETIRTDTSYPETAAAKEKTPSPPAPSSLPSLAAAVQGVDHAS